ncbi:two-component system sensor histidine kinase NtrB [Kurthia sibirica]|nr:ATP-binding protein [Kurthia sibirica]
MHSSTLRKRNKVILSIVTASILLYAIVSMVSFLEEIDSFPLTLLLLCAVIIFLFNRKVNEILVCSLIIMTINLTLVHIIFISMNIYYSIILIIALFIISIYQSAYLNAFVLLLFGSEIAWFFYAWYPELIIAIGETNIAVLIILLALLSTISLIQGYYFSMSYRHIEEKSDTREKEFLSKEGYLKLFFENAKDSIAVFDLNNYVIAVNPAFEKLYGWDGDECIGKLLPMVPPAGYEQSKDRINRMLAGESFHLLETVDMKKDGTIFDAEVTLSPIFDQFGKIIATSVITRDISYRKEAEKIRVEAEKLNIAGEIAAGVAHEIRNPLTVISGFVQMMKADKNSPNYYYFSLINEEIERINLIISEFLVLSKPHAKEMTIFDIHDILNHVKLLFDPQFQSHHIILTEELLAEYSHIKGDANQIKQVFINIFKNAIEAIDDTGHMNVETKWTGTHIAIAISDSGNGMSQKVIDHIFEPFFTTKEHGTGLGMLITNKIIQEHGGVINIDSMFGQGTTITIMMPVHSNELMPIH